MPNFVFELDNSTPLPDNLLELWITFKIELRKANFYNLKEEHTLRVIATQTNDGECPVLENDPDVPFHPPLNISFIVEIPNEESAGVLIRLFAGAQHNVLCMADIKAFNWQIIYTIEGVAKELTELLTTTVNMFLPQKK